MKGFEFYEPKPHCSVSSLCCMYRCPRYYFYRCGCRLGLEGEHPALKFGEAIHAAIPYAFIGDIEKAMSLFSTVWGTTPEDRKRNPIRAEAMLKDFARAHQSGNSIYTPLPAPPNRATTERALSEYEVPFVVDVGIPVPFVGRIDCRGKHRDTGKTWGVEYKTTSELGQCFINSFALSPQVLCYALALKVLVDEDLEGYFIEGLLVAEKSCNTLAIPITIRPHFIKAALQWIGNTYSKIQACEENQDFPPDYAGCNPYHAFGRAGYSCMYEPLCSVEDWTSLKDMYIQFPEYVFSM